MKALSVQQPYANKIIFHGKDIENRTRCTSFQGTVAIHASMKLHPNAKLSKKAKDELVRGAIVGVVDVVDCVDNHKSKWFIGPYGYVLKNPRPLATPIPCKGMLGFWKVSPKMEREIKRQLKGQL
jgi:hypothetical protein